MEMEKFVKIYDNSEEMIGNVYKVWIYSSDYPAEYENFKNFAEKVFDFVSEHDGCEMVFARETLDDDFYILAKGDKDISWLCFDCDLEMSKCNSNFMLFLFTKYLL